MFNNIRKIIIAAVMISIPSMSFAGEATGKVNYIVVRHSDGLVYFALNAQGIGKPGCATYEYWMIKDENSLAGKQQLATLMMAKAANKTITVNGYNTCTRWGDGEDVNIILIRD